MNDIFSEKQRPHIYILSVIADFVSDEQASQDAAGHANGRSKNAYNCKININLNES